MFTFHDPQVLARAAKRIASRARDAYTALLSYWIIHLPVCLDPMQFLGAVIAAVLTHLYRVFRPGLAAAKPRPIKVARKGTTNRVKELLRT